MPYNLQDEELLHRLRRQASDTAVDSTSSAPEPTQYPTSTSETTSTATTTSSSTTTTTSSTPTSTPGSTSSPTPTPTPTPTPVPSNSDVSSQSQTTSLISTTAVIVTNGSTITTVTATPTIIPGGQTSSKSSNIGPIVGGVAGGIGLLAIVIVLFWLIRRRTRKVELDGDIFDPDRNVARPGRLDGSLDLSEPQMLARPYNYQLASTGGGGGGGAAAAAVAGGAAGAGLAGVGTDRYSQSHRQSSVAPGELFPHNQYPYGQSPYPPAGGHPQSAYASQGPVDLNRGPSDGSAYGGVAASSEYPYSSVTSPTSGPNGPSSDGGASQGVGYLGAFPAGATQYSASTSSSAAAKAQQVADARRMRVANEEDGPSGPIMQHQDGGRAPQEGPSPPTEVPPAYDSIPREEPGPSGAGPASASNEAREAAARLEKSARPLFN